MKALAHRRARITRVREVQHLQASGAAATAEGKVVQLEGNAARLSALRNSLSAETGATTGAQLGNLGELGLRLDGVRGGLDQSIANARDAAASRVAERQAAHIARETAAKLEGRAVAALQAMIEERMAAAMRPRRKERDDG